MSSLNFKDVLTRIDHLVIKTYLYITEALYLVSTSPDTAKYPNMIAGPCKTNITTSYDATLYTKVILSQKKTSKQNWQRYVCEWSLLESHEIRSLAFLEGNCACMNTKVPKERKEGLLVGSANARLKKLHARELSRNQSILRFDVTFQHDWPIEQCLLHIRVFFGGKTKSSCFDLFIHWLIHVY